MKFTGIIPARWSSTRFPGKPLVNIGGKSMIQRVYEQAMQCRSLQHVIIATDDERIAEEAKKFSGRVVMTSTQHQSGTARCAEVLSKMENEVDVVINIQGDEPFIHPEQIELLCKQFSIHPHIQIVTLIKTITDLADIQNPNCVKVVKDKINDALYFSRAAIPHLRDGLNTATFYKHVGIYAYNSNILKHIVTLPEGKLEQAENLEQLRWLENGIKISTVETAFENISVDTPDDLEKIKQMYV